MGGDHALARREGRAAGRAEVIEAYLPLVRRMARRFSNRGEQVEDLVQVGSVAMIRAVDRCDPERAGQLTAYVARCVDGELRRYLRDHSSVVRIPRALHGHTAAAVPLEAAADPVDSAQVDDLSVARALVSAAAASLDSRERRVVALRYFLDLSQQEIGADVGVSQVHVSRLLRSAVAKMRARLEPAGGPPPR